MNHPDHTYPKPKSGVYYKATQPDGRDFYSGTVLYEVGKRVRPVRVSSRPRICGPGYLHAADVPGMTLIGGSWPCRLFEVTGRPAVGFDHEHPHKAGFLQLTVVRELPAHWALGPNGLIVSRVIDRTRKITYREALYLAARGVSRGVARGVSQGAARIAARVAARVAAWDAAQDAARIAAWDAAQGAAQALLVQDLITPDQFTQLFSAWQQVIGEDF